MGFVGDIVKGAGNAVGSIVGGVGNAVGGIGSGVGGMFGMGGGGGNPMDPGSLGGSPQSRGYGMNPYYSSAPMQMYQTAPGLAPGGATDANSVKMGKAGGGAMAKTPEGWDFASPGVAEQYFNNQQNQFAPGASQTEQYRKEFGGQLGQAGSAEQLWNRSSGQLDRAGGAEQYWNQTQGKLNGPTASEGVFGGFDASRNAGLDPYYDRANTKLASRLNQQAAMTGSLGGTASNAMMAEGLSGLAAEQANRESDYYLQQNQLAGSLANQADSNRLNQITTGGQLSNMAQDQQLARLGLANQMAAGADSGLLGRLQLGGTLAGTADANTLARTNAGFASAMGAQDARNTRGRNYMADLAGQTANMQGIMGGYDQMLTDDQALMDSAIAANLGLGAEAVNRGDRQADKLLNDAGKVVDIYSSIYGMGGGGG